MSAETFPIELESRVVDCRTEQERTMLTEAHNICCDSRIGDRHSKEHLQAISKTCFDYGLNKMGGAVAASAERRKQ
jgi:hypothetical protein